MSEVLDEVLTANARYAATFGDKGKLPLPSVRSNALKMWTGGQPFRSCSSRVYWSAEQVT